MKFNFYDKRIPTEKNQDFHILNVSAFVVLLFQQGEEGAILLSVLDNIIL